MTHTARRRTTERVGLSRFNCTVIYFTCLYCNVFHTVFLTNCSILDSTTDVRNTLSSDGAKKDSMKANDLRGDMSNTLRRFTLNSDCGSLIALVSIPKAHDAITSVVNLAVHSFTSTGESVTTIFTYLLTYFMTQQLSNEGFCI